MHAKGHFHRMNSGFEFQIVFPATQMHPIQFFQDLNLPLLIGQSGGLFTGDKLDHFGWIARIVTNERILINRW